MCLLKPPFDASSLPALALKISRGEYTPIPKHYSVGLKKMVGDMMQVDPNKRPTIHEILNSPLIRDKVTMSRFGDGGESSNGSLLEVSLVKKVSGGRGLVIDANMDDYSSIEYIVSPKSQLSNHSKHHDMPVKRIDNYTK